MFNKENKRLEKERFDYMQENMDLKKKIRAFEDIHENDKRTIDDLDKKLIACKKELKEMSGIARDQNDADLLINALKAIGIIPKGKSDPDNAAEEQKLMSQRDLINYAQGMAYQSNYRQGGLGSSLLGSCGGSFI